MHQLAQLALGFARLLYNIYHTLPIDPPLPPRRQKDLWTGQIP